MKPVARPLISLLVAYSALANSARVIVDDTLEWGAERVRLLGFDAPELMQSCQRDGETWPCGKEVCKALARWIGDRDVGCIGDEWGKE